MLRKLPDFILLFAICGLLTSQAVAVGAPPVGESHVYKKVDDRELKLYVTKPTDWKQTDSRPAIVFFHGGGWTGGAPGQFTEHSKYLVTRGMVCVQVQYRLLDKKGSEPPTTCCRDAKSAMRWVRSRAAELGIDPDRIASGGGSAGTWRLSWAWLKAPTIPRTTQKSRPNQTRCACSTRFLTTGRVAGEQNVSEIGIPNSRRSTTCRKTIRQGLCFSVRLIP
jgi:carboxylesterase type B